MTRHNANGSLKALPLKGVIEEAQRPVSSGEKTGTSLPVKLQSGRGSHPLIDFSGGREP